MKFKLGEALRNKTQQPQLVKTQPVKQNKSFQVTGIKQSGDGIFIKTTNGLWEINEISPQEFHAWLNIVTPIPRDKLPTIDKLNNLQYRLSAIVWVCKYHETLMSFREAEWVRDIKKQKERWLN